MHRIKKAHATGIICILFAIWIIYETGNIPERLVSNEPGPKLFPYISAAGIILFSLLSMIFDGRREENKPYLTREGWKRLGIIFAEFVMFAVGMKYLGFMITGIIMMFVFIFTLKGEKKVNPIVTTILAVGLTILVYMSFVHAFYIPLPSGELWKLLGIKLPF